MQNFLILGWPGMGQLEIRAMSRPELWGPMDMLLRSTYLQVLSPHAFLTKTHDLNESVRQQLNGFFFFISFIWTKYGNANCTFNDA